MLSLQHFEWAPTYLWGLSNLAMVMRRWDLPEDRSLLVGGQQSNQKASRESI